VTDADKRGAWGMSHPEHLANVTKWGFLGLDMDQLIALATLDNVQLGGEMSELDDAGTYFDLLPHKAIGTGTHHYMCTRNNNFSNRSQKGKIVVAQAPENTVAIGSQGGVIGMTLEDRWLGTLTDTLQILQNSDYSVWVPPGSFSSLQQVTSKVWASNNGQIGMANAASDVLFLGPSNLAAMTTFTPSQLTGTGNRRDTRATGGTLTDVWATFNIVDGSTVEYLITSPSFKAWYQDQVLTTGVEPTVTLKFTTSSGVLATVQTGINVNFQIQGQWTQMSAGYIKAVEAGNVWITLIIDGDEYKGLPLKVEESGEPILVKVPVSVSLQSGEVYHWPDTPAAKDCIMSGDDSTSCNLLRNKISATIKDGVATFAVGDSQSQPAGGYYQVSQGSNLAMILAVAITCFLVALVIVGGAVYYRKNPAKFESLRGWGPKKYKSIKRSLASSV